MTALTNKGLALKLAVEHVTDSGDYNLLDDDGDALAQVFALADKFSAYISGQPTEGTNDTATDQGAAVAGPTAQDAVNKILAALDENQGDLGRNITDTARQQVRALRSDSYAGVFTAAERAIDQNTAFLGRPAADTLRRLVRQAR